MPERWSAQKAHEWYRQQPWLVGCNFITSSAINQLEMWQESTFDLPGIDRELGWASGVGFNCMRVYLHDLLWSVDAEGFKKRMNHYLEVASKHGIKTMFVLFDDCWNKEFSLGPQPLPKPGVHNSGWLQSPGEKIVLDQSGWTRLEKYVKEVVTAFANDKRVLIWDLYNEPGNQDLNDRSIPLLKKVFEWAREVNPSQPLTSAVFADMGELNKIQLELSDVISFHNYNEPDNLRQQIVELKKLGRPMICSEYMARTRGSQILTNLPIFREENVGAINWGLVSGKTQTIFPWRSPEGAPEPAIWFHDIFRPDGTPFDEKETALVGSLSRQK